MSQAKYTIGLDYGTDSVRSLIVNTENGEEVASVVFSFLALPVLIIGLLFLASRRIAWVLALFMQALILSLAMVGYFSFRHPYVYLVMGYSIFMVFYLNHYEIQASFRTLRKSEPVE